MRIATIIASILLCISVSICLASPPVPAVDSTKTASNNDNLRGVDRDERFAGDPWRVGLNVLFFIPRETTNGILYLGGRGLNAATDPDLVEFVEKLLYFYERRAGWYPMVMVDSEFRPEAGINLFYKDDLFKTSIDAKFADEHRWRSRLKLKLRSKSSRIPWFLSFRGEFAEEDDRVYYGIGADPQEDDRSHFLPEATEENADYMQQRRKAVLSSGFEINQHMNLISTLMYSNRKVSNPPEEDDRIGDIFNVSELTGINQAVELMYAEMEITLDSRSNGSISPAGITIEGYTGYAEGVNSDIEYLRVGSDIEVFIPLLKNNRLIVPHIALNMVENLNDDLPLPFTEYPRHPTFRGVSSRRLLRIDNLSLVPSIEYRWPLTHSVNGYLFTDVLMVSEDFEHISSKDAPWAAGFGMRVRIHRIEVGGLSAAVGSEGIRILLSIGAETLRPTRSNWK